MVWRPLHVLCQSFIGKQPHLFLYVLSVAPFGQIWQSWVIGPEVCPYPFLPSQNCSSQITAKVIVLQWRWVIPIVVWTKTMSFPWYSICWRNSLSPPALSLKSFFFSLGSSNTLPGSLQSIALSTWNDLPFFLPH